MLIAIIKIFILLKYIKVCAYLIFKGP